VIHALNQAFVAMGRARSLDFDIGDRLYGLMVRPGMTVVTARFVQPVVPLSIAAAFLELGAREMRQVAIRSGVISQLDADAAVAALVGLTRSREGYYAFPREAQVAVQLA